MDFTRWRSSPLTSASICSMPAAIRSSGVDSLPSSMGWLRVSAKELLLAIAAPRLDPAGKLAKTSFCNWPRLIEKLLAAVCQLNPASSWSCECLGFSEIGRRPERSVAKLCLAAGDRFFQLFNAQSGRCTHPSNDVSELMCFSIGHCFEQRPHKLVVLGKWFGLHLAFVKRGGRWLSRKVLRPVLSTFH